MKRISLVIIAFASALLCAASPARAQYIGNASAERLAIAPPPFVLNNAPLSSATTALWVKYPGVTGTATVNMIETPVYSQGLIIPKNFIGCASDTVSTSALSSSLSAAVALPCFYVHQLAGAGATGSHTAIGAYLDIIGTVTGAGGNDYYNALFANLGINGNAGGNSSTPLGEAYGLGVQATAYAGGSFYFTLFGAEVDVAAQSGSTPFNKAGVLVAAFNSDHDHGACQSWGGGVCGLDAAFAAENTTSGGYAGSGGFNQGIALGLPGVLSTFPVTASGVVFAANGCSNATVCATSASASVKSDLDFSNIDCTDTNGAQFIFAANSNAAHLSKMDCYGDLTFSGLLVINPSSTFGGANFTVADGGFGNMFAVLGQTSGTIASHITLSTSKTTPTTTISISASDEVGGTLTGSSINLVPYGTGCIQINGDCNVAFLDVTGQAITGGAVVTTQSISAGSYTVNCGNRPEQYIANTGAWTLTAPASDSTCVLDVENGSGAALPTLSGFAPNTMGGATMDTTSGHNFRLIVIRNHSHSSVYAVALQ